MGNGRGARVVSRLLGFAVFATLVVVGNVHAASVTVGATGGDGKIDLSWNVAGDLRNVQVMRDTDSNPAGRQRVAILGGNARGYTDTTVENGRQYWYWIKYTDTAGAVGSSNAETATPGADYTLELGVGGNGNGSTSISPGSHSYKSGTAVTITATPASGSAFSGWSGAFTGNTNPLTVTMNGNKSLTAMFTAQDNSNDGNRNPVADRPVSSDTQRRVLSPQSPMYLIHVTYNAGDTPEEIIGAVPEDVLPYVVLNLNPAGTKMGTDEGYLLMRKWLQAAKDKGVWAMVQPSAGIRNRMDDADTTNYEKLYADFPNMIGYNWSEQTWGYNAATFNQRLNLLSDLIEMSAKYGGYVYVNDSMSISNSGWNTIAKFKTHQRFRDAAKRFSDHVIFGNKTTQGYGFFDNESMTLGAFLGGYAGHYAIRYDQHAWMWSGKTELFGFEGTREQAEAKGALPIFSNPEGLMGAYITEQMLLSGASVIDGPEVEWMSAVFDGKPTPNFNNVMIDIVRKVLDGTIVIPTRQEVAKRTKVALVSDGSSNNTPASLFTDVYKMDNDGELKQNARWLKKTGRYPTIPYLYGRPADSGSYDLVIDQSAYDSAWPSHDIKVRQLNELFPAESTGDMFVGRVGNRWLAYNPYVNTDRVTGGEFDLLYSSCSSIAMSYTPHTFSVIKEGDRSLSIYLNNYRTDKSALWRQYGDSLSIWRLQTYVLPEFVSNPPDSALRQSTIVLKGCTSEPYITVTERGSHKPSKVTSSYQNGEFAITALHNGPIDIAVGNAMGDNAHRLPMPPDRPVLPPGSPGQGVWLEAECGSLGSLWTSPQSATAANGRYVTAANGHESIDSPPSKEGQISLSFNVGSSGEYGVWGRVRAPSYNDDSFWVKVNDESWINWGNLAIANEWTWKKVATRNLNAGSNAITIGFRENGTHLDKLFIGKGTPVGYGESASNRCN